jgi:hypothetical protein
MVNSDAGLVVLMPTFPPARMRNWLLLVEAKAAFCESAHTNAPACSACACWPAARLYWPLARF